MIIESIGMKELLEAGVHFGHKSSDWNPGMKKYIFMKKRGVHIIDLQKTIIYVERVHNLVKNVVASGGDVLFVGTKKQAKKIVKEVAEACGQHYITQRWIGGLLSNFDQVRKSIHRLEEYEKILNSIELQENYKKKQLVQIEKKYKKMMEAFGGIRTMNSIPKLIFVVDSNQEEVALKEAKLRGVITAGIMDTNADPTLVEHIIPGNDDAIRSIGLFLGYMGHAVKEGLNFRSASEKVSRVEEEFESGDDLKVIAEEKKEEVISEQIATEKGKV